MGFYSPVKNEVMVISEVELEAIILNKVIQTQAKISHFFSYVEFITLKDMNVNVACGRFRSERRREAMRPVRNKMAKVNYIYV